MGLLNWRKNKRILANEIFFILLVTSLLLVVILSVIVSILFYVFIGTTRNEIACSVTGCHFLLHS